MGRAKRKNGAAAPTVLEVLHHACGLLNEHAEWTPEGDPANAHARTLVRMWKVCAAAKVDGP